MYEAITRDIKISVETKFIAEQSDPEENYFVWAYRITIENIGHETVQLISRHWRITDALGRLQEVKGDGVIGEQPVIEPGASFTYSSGTPLNTPSGFMVGTYQMHTEDGNRFDAEVPGFSLDSPHGHEVMH
ncbi:MAG: Co2+/Mg2+ efflux protein ApaG [Parvibaculales bacterium]